MSERELILSGLRAEATPVGLDVEWHSIPSQEHYGIAFEGDVMFETNDPGAAVAFIRGWAAHNRYTRALIDQGLLTDARRGK